jgi:site-specific recombinase XerC
VDGGRYGAYISVAGQVLRRRFRSIEEAQTWIDAQSASVSCDLTALQLQDAASALAILPPGVSLRQCADYYLETHASINASQPIMPILAEYLAYQEKRCKYDTMRTYRQCLNRALMEISDDLAEYTQDRIKRCIANYTPHQHNHILRALRTFFNWAIEHGHASMNPCDGIKKKKEPEPSRAIFSLAQVEHLLHSIHATRPHLLGYFCLCLFEGLRPSEAQRIPPHCVGVEYVNLPAGIVKTSQARTVPVEPGLTEVLARYPLGRRASMSIRRARESTGLEWVQDVMRHSYASYAYERSRDASATAYDMGHKGTDIFFRHYRGLVAPGDGQKYFKILADFAKFLQRNA